METPVRHSAPDTVTVSAPRAATRSPLDRSLDLALVSGWTVAWAVVGLVAVGLRLPQLERFALAPAEAQRAFDAWALYTGNPLGPGESLPTTEPLMLLLEALSFFLFSATDASARLVSAIVGLLILVLIWMLQPIVGRATALGMATLVAISPTVVLASRTVDPGILVAASALLVVVSVCRAGLAARRGISVRRWAIATGVGLGLMLASGPAAISVFIALVVGVILARLYGGAASPAPAAGTAEQRENAGNHTPPAPEPDEDSVVSLPGAVSAGLGALTRSAGGPALVLTGFIATTVVLFTRLFSDIGALAGVLDTFADWVDLLGSGTSATPTQFFLLSLLLYEFLAVAFAIVAVVRGDDQSASDGQVLSLGWPFFAGWFITTLLLFGFSAGRAPEQAIHVAFPLVLFGGVGLGYLIDRVAWRSVFRGEDGVLLLSFLGIVAGLFAIVVLTGRLDEATDQTRLIIQIAVVAIVVIGGLVYLGTAIIQHQRMTGRVSQAGRIALLAMFVVLGALTFRTTTELNFYNLARGNELLAQNRPTESVDSLVYRLGRLSRDVSVDRISVRDPLGTYGLTIAIDERVEWPFRWYFRQFPDAEVVSAGQGPSTGAEVVLAPDETGLTEVGYTVQPTTYLNRVPVAYTTPDIGSVLRAIFVPSEWPDSLDYLIYRRLDDPAPATTMVAAYSDPISGRLFPSSGPFNLFEPTDPGSNPGQLNSPRGVAVSPDGDTIYVVDSLNARVQRYDENGVFISAWGGADGTSSVSFALFAPTESAIFGPTGIAVGADGVVYVADTWNHRVVGLSPDGTVVREIGTPGERVDIGDDPTMVGEQPGRFFGPRGVAVSNEEIYVVDTGNERVQVFGLDGTFRRVFGGFGSAPGQLIEPVGIAVSEDGFVYVADSGNGRISVFTTDGTPVAQWPVPEWANAVYDPLTGARPGFEPAVALGPDGLVYVTSRITSSIVVFDQSGREIGQIGQVGEGVLAGPVGITFDREGYLYVSDADLNAVFRSDSPIEPTEAETPTQATPQAGTDEDSAVPSDGTPVLEEATPELGIVALPGGETPGDATPDATPGQGQPDVAEPADTDTSDTTDASRSPTLAPLPSPPGGIPNG